MMAMAFSDRARNPGFCRCPRGPCPPEVRVAIGCDDLSRCLSTSRLSMEKAPRAAAGPRTATVETVRAPAGSSLPDRVGARFAAPRHFTLDGPDRAGPESGV